MKICLKCGTIQDDTAAFCGNCGVAIPKADTPASEPQTAELPVCAGCGTPVNKDDAFCQNCGTPVGITASQIVGLPIQRTEAVHAAGAGEEGILKPKMTRLLMIAAAAVVVIAAAVAGIFLFGSSEKAYLLYLKDNEINMTGLNKIEPFQLTDDLYDDIDSFDGYQYSYINISDDGKYMFYPESISDSDDTMDLYYIALKANNAKENSAVKIESGISSYRISRNGTRVFYLKKDRLYFYNLREKVKIDTDISAFYISDDGMKLVYLTGDDDLYMKDMKSGDAEKIDGDVSDIPRVYDSGELYYIKRPSETVPLSDYVKDDMTADAVMEEPDYGDFIKESSAGYKYFDDDAYYDAWDAYDEKQDRDYLRSELKANTYTVNRASLYYYDGSASSKVTDAYNTYLSGGRDTAILVFSKYRTADIPTLNLSEITSYYDVQSILDTWLYTSFDTSVAIGSKEKALDQDSAELFRISEEGSKLYFIQGNPASNSYNLYAVPINGDTVGTPELYDVDVSHDYLHVASNGAVVYFKGIDSDNDCGDLFINKINVDTDVYSFNVRLTGDDKTQLIYLADFDDDDYIGTLKVYDGNKAVKISDDVYSYVTDGKGTIAYITNFDTDDDVGDAYLYNGSKPQLIDDEVSDLLMIG